MAINTNTTRIGTVHALQKQVARHAPTQEIAAAQMHRLRRLALLVGRPIPPRQKAQN